MAGERASAVVLEILVVKIGREREVAVVQQDAGERCAVGVAEVESQRMRPKVADVVGGHNRP
jgi:hypothetical protein